MKNLSVSSAIALSLGLSALSSLHAADGTYTSTAASGLWDDTENWADGIVAGGMGAVADIEITRSGIHVLEFTDDIMLGVLNLSNMAGAYEFKASAGSGARLRMDNGDEAAVIYHQNSTGTSDINADILFGSGGLRIESAASSGALNIDRFGAYTIRTDSLEEGTAWLAFSHSGSGIMGINTRVLDGSGVVGVRVEKGIVSVRGNNSYTGGIVIQGGTLRATNAGLGNTDDHTNTLHLGNESTGSSSTTFQAVLSEDIKSNISVTAGVSGAAVLTAQFDASDVDRTSTFSGDITLGRDLTVQTIKGVRLTGVVSGSGQLILSSTQNVADRFHTVSGENTHTGGTVLSSSATLYNFAHAKAPGTGTFQIGGTTATQISDVSIDNTSGAALEFTNNNALSLKNFTFVGTNDLHMGYGTVTITPGVAIVTSLQNTLTIGGVIGGAKSFGNAGDGTVKLTGLNTYTNRTTVGGVLEVQNLANGGAASNIGASGNGASNLVLNRGTLKYTGGGSTTDRGFTLGNGGGAIDSSGTGALIFDNTDQVMLTENVSLSIAPGAATYGAGATVIYVGGTANGSTADLAVGMSVSGTQIAPGTVITNILDGGRIEISNPTTAQATTGTLSFGALSRRDLTLTGSNADDNTLAASLSDTSTGTVGLKKSGSGKWIITGDHTYTGDTSVDEGTLVVAGAGTLNGSAVKVAAGARFVYDSSVARTEAIALDGNGANRAALSGAGRINTALTLNNLGDTLSPGEGIGQMTFGSNQTWESFTYEFDILNITGNAAGSDFDHILIQGGLDLTGTGSAYVLDLRSLADFGLTSDDIDGLSWTILTADSGITGFDASRWTIQLDHFATSGISGGTWWLSQSGTDLQLNYAAVPEPSTFALIVGGIGIWWAMRRRRLSVA